MTQIDYNLTATNQDRPTDVILVAAVNPDGSNIGGGGGGGGGNVTVTNFPATQPVSGTVSVTGVATAANQTSQTTVLNAISTAVGELNSDFGMPSQAAWAGTGDGTVIAILKAMYAQNEAMLAQLQAINTNTSST